MADPAKPKIRHIEARIFFSLVCVLVVVARAVHPTWFDDALDYVPVALAALPWLGFFVTEVKLPGGVEAKLAEIEQKAETAEKKAEAAQKEAAETKVETRLMGVAPPAGPTKDGTIKVFHANLVDDGGGMEQLAARYNTIRATQPSGSARTADMSGVMREMVAAARADGTGTGYAAHAQGDDEGMRLAAAAWAVAHCDRAAPLPLINALYASTQPFVHYWLLMALNQIAERQGRAVFSADMAARLQGFRPYVATGADRAYLLGQILQKLGLP